MTEGSKIALIKELLDTAESNLRSAKNVLIELAGGKIDNNSKYSDTAGALPKMTADDKGDKILEGVFDGQNMIGSDKKTYPVPANYASKSKLIPGDVLKLTIQENGSFLYKQIGPIERRQVIGHLIYEDNQYKVIAEGKTYKVLLASVTYFKAEVGDKVTLVIPALEDSEWGAIENVLPPEEDEIEEGVE